MVGWWQTFSYASDLTNSVIQLDPGVNNFEASEGLFYQKPFNVHRSRTRTEPAFGGVADGELVSWPRSLFAEWGSSCALALCAYRGPHLTNSSENKLQQPLAGVLTSQISTFSSENKLQQLHIFFQEWKSRVQWEVWGQHRGGSSALQVSYCHSFVVYPWTLDKVKVKQSTFQLKFYLFFIWIFILYNYYTCSKEGQKNNLKIKFPIDCNWFFNQL